MINVINRIVYIIAKVIYTESFFSFSHRVSSVFFAIKKAEAVCIYFVIFLGV